MTKPFTLFFTVQQDEDGLLLRDFLSKHQISKRAVTGIKHRGGFFKVNGKEERVLCQLQTNDTVEVQYPLETANEKIVPYAFPLEIIYEDDYLLLVNKPDGMSTIPSHEHPTQTLANALAYHYAQTNHSGAMHFVTRLDYDTSGLVLVAKHSHIHHLFDRAQEKKEIKKEYLALCTGTPTPAQGEINFPIARVPGSVIKREVNPEGQTACTLYRTEQTYANYSRLRLRLLTGRTHQIRVHLSALGHPLLGDSLYGGSQELIKRQALHCYALQFQHPLTGELLQFTCEPPMDMIKLI